MKELKAKIDSESYEMYLSTMKRIQIEKILLLTLSVVTGGVKAEIDFRYYHNRDSDHANFSETLIICEVVSTSIRMVTNSYMTMQAIILVAFFIRLKIKRSQGSSEFTLFNIFIIILIFLILL